MELSTLEVWQPLWLYFYLMVLHLALESTKRQDLDLIGNCCFSTQLVKLASEACSSVTYLLISII